MCTAGQLLCGAAQADKRQSSEAWLAVWLCLVVVTDYRPVAEWPLAGQVVSSSHIAGRKYCVSVLSCIELPFFPTQVLYLNRSAPLMASHPVTPLALVAVLYSAQRITSSSAALTHAEASAQCPDERQRNSAYAYHIQTHMDVTLDDESVPSSLDYQTSDHQQTATNVVTQL